MQALFFGICTHIDSSVEITQSAVRSESTVSPSPRRQFSRAVRSAVSSVDVPIHRVALAGSGNYTVKDPTGLLLAIPNHRPQLAIRRADVLTNDLEGEIQKFAGDNLHPFPTTDESELCWSLDKVIFDFGGLEAPLTTDLHCLPHIGLTGVELEPGLTEGDDLGSAAAFIDVSNGALSVVRDSTDPVVQGRHVRLMADPQRQPWLLQVRSPHGERRALTMKADAAVTFSNTAISAIEPCSDNDYLLNFRLTTSPFIPPQDFVLPPDCDPVAIDMTLFPWLRPENFSGTLSDCSNTVYP